MKRLYKYIAPFVIITLVIFVTPIFANASTLTNGIVAYWKYDDGTGSTAADATGNGNTGTLSGASPPTWTTSGLINDALSYGGSTSYTSVSDTAALDPTAITINAWIKFNSLSDAYNTIVQKGNGTAYVEYFATSGGKMAEYMIASGGGINYDGTGTHTLSTGTWYMVTFTYDSSQGLIGYVNGAQDGTGAANGTLTSTSGSVLSVGADQFTTGRYSNAIIDEVGVWNRALTSTEVSNLYNSGSGLQYPFGTMHARVTISKATVYIKNETMTVL